MEIIIRKVQLKDLPRISEVNHSAYGNWSDPFCLRQYFDLLQETYYVAELSGVVVGFCVAAIKPRSNEGWIMDLAVEADNQGSGIGKKLLTNALDVLRDGEISDVFLTVDPEKKKVMKLYEKFGFSVVGEEDDYFGKGRRRLLMKAEL